MMLYSFTTLSVNRVSITKVLWFVIRTLKSVNGLPPSKSGIVHVMNRLMLVCSIAIKFVGIPGTVAAVEERLSC